jgi:Flp pilus assembly protein TadG
MGQILEDRPASLIARARNLVALGVDMLKSRNDGVAAVEFAILVPMLVAMFVYTVDMALSVYQSMQLDAASQAGVHYAVLNGFNATAISSAVTNSTSLTGMTVATPTEFCGCPSGTAVVAQTCATQCSNGSQAGSYISVTVSKNYGMLLPYTGMSSSMALSSTATGRLQ